MPQPSSPHAVRATRAPEPASAGSLAAIGGAVNRAGSPAGRPAPMRALSRGRAPPVPTSSAPPPGPAIPRPRPGYADRALLVLAFAGAFRRSELVALDVADVEQVPDGLRILVRSPRPTRRRLASASLSPTA